MQAVSAFRAGAGDPGRHIDLFGAAWVIARSLSDRAVFARLDLRPIADRATVCACAARPGSPVVQNLSDRLGLRVPGNCSGSALAGVRLLGGRAGPRLGPQALRLRRCCWSLSAQSGPHRRPAGACHPSTTKGMTMVKTPAVTGGVDTHADTHVAAALGGIGGLLGAGDPGADGRHCDTRSHE
jgi:hypothetical protein